MRDYLHAASVEFDERNIRHNHAARAELQNRTGSMVVPVLIYGDESVVGFDPDGIDRVIETYRSSS